MNREECKNCPLIEEIARLKAKIEELEKKLEKYEKPPKDSSNSSVPPSLDKDKKYPPRKKSGGQERHQGNTRKFVENPDEIVELYPEKCECCGNEHFIKKENILDKRQVTDIPPIKPYTVEYQQKAGICNKCGTRNVGKFPVESPVSFGNRITGIIGYLNVQHHVGYDRIIQIFNDLLGLGISKGSIDNKINELSKSLKPTYCEILEKLKQSSVIGSDETGTRIDGKNGYQWTFQNKFLTFFKSSFSIGFNVIEEIIGCKFNGSWISDRYGAQLKIEAEHQLCLPHLIRDLEYIEQAEKSKWARKLKLLFENMMKFRRLQEERFNPFDPETFRTIQKLKKALYRIFLKAPPKKLEKTLFNSLLCRQNQLTLFLDNPEVPYDNNGSERALRNRVIKRKISGGFRTLEGALCHDVIASVIETAKKQGKNVFQILISILSGSQFLLTN
jgi:transposase